jgi:DNA-binding response OmpR family regulator
VHCNGKRILCVESHEDTCFMLQVLLELAGYAVKTASTVAEALSLAQDQQFDLYLLDYGFPDGTGVQLCQQIRALGQRAPIMFCSGRALPADRQQALGAGAQLFLTKPIDPEVLGQSVRQLLREGAASPSDKRAFPASN